jgi:hypothetical protein
MAGGRIRAQTGFPLASVSRTRATSRHPQRPITGQVAPGQAEVTVGAVASHEGAVEVEAVLTAPHGDRYFPAG